MLHVIITNQNSPANGAAMVVIGKVHRATKVAMTASCIMERPPHVVLSLE